jgi:hypothetical protein
MLTISSELLEERIEYRRLDSHYPISVLTSGAFGLASPEHCCSQRKRRLPLVALNLV